MGVPLAALVVVGASGAVTALGDTLFPPTSLAAGFAQDFAPGAHLFVRLRALHPLLAVSTGAAIIVAGSLARALRPSRTVRALSCAASALVVAQVAAGLLDVTTLAPVWTPARAPLPRGCRLDRRRAHRGCRARRCARAADRRVVGGRHRASLSTSAGAPRASMRPHCIDHTVSASSPARRISCVTRTIVSARSARQRTQHAAHLLAHLRIERARRLVEQQDAQRHRQRARDGHALLLTARQLREGRRRRDRRGRRCARSSSPAAIGLASRLRRDDARSERHVAQRRQVREEVKLLEDHPHRLSERAHLPAIACDAGRRASSRRSRPCPAVEGLERVEAPEERRLAAPARAHDRDDLALLHLRRRSPSSARRIP